MKNRKILNVGILTLLLNSVAMGADHGCAGGVCFATIVKKSNNNLTTTALKQGIGCDGGACFVPLSNIKPSKTLEEKKEFVGIKFLEEEKNNKDNLDNNMDDFDTLVFDRGEIPELYLESEDMNEKKVQNEEKVVIEEKMMTEERVMDTLWRANPVNITEDKILEKTLLPSSDYVCEKDKHVVYLNSDVYECV